MSLYASCIVQSQKMLTNLDKWLEAGEAYAKEKSFDAGVLLESRLAADQYALVRQVQAACDSAKSAAAHLTGQTPPKHPDTEKTMEELHARIRTVLAYLATFKEADFEGADKRHVELSFIPGKFILGNDYEREMFVPNFYFHVSHAYGILRHNGVPLGKMAYIGSITLHDK